ncbi:ferritin-like domain-containing protein [Hymenobacter sp. HSC-4F20]|uniref:ferritin-like domain-containing protein n=1 Tax=Hymenobacter sp. HSC-4F20 TaxID=2864135 RepID=UPI001C73D124|nr:ferritin-like domain-containing protein [Hymenobacter sp. HSC-4F20]MBX0291084.1 ferritin-like domain-containing protein [Hymenobacter sp. HSC-4F20]
MSDSASSFSGRPLRRRSFLRVAGATAASSALLLAGCGDDDSSTVAPTTNTLTFANSNTGLLNYAYLLEQLEAAFYQKVVDAFPPDFTAEDRAAFLDLRDHEVIHRETLKFALGSSAYDTSLGETPLAFDFSSFTLTSRAGVYAAARTLEDVGVAAYNGVGKLLLATNDNSHVMYLRLLAKIASVEARHAAFVRDQQQANSFAGADVVATSGSFAGLDTVKTPVEVVALIAKYVPIPLDASLLPTT